MTVTLPDGAALEVPDGATGADVAATISEGLARVALGIRVDGELRDLSAPLPEGATVEIVTPKSEGTLAEDALWLVRHDTAHVLAAAVMELYPGVKISIGPPIDDGFYYDFEFPEDVKLSDADFERIETEMRKHIKADEHFTREDVPVAEALERFRAEGQDYKVELIEDLVRDADPAHPVETVSLYTNGPFTDLCRGPHAPSTKRIKAFKLTSVAGAYWRGDADDTMLTRVYGTAFLSKDDLAAHLERLEEARKRDHRKLGRELDLFFLSEISPGSPFWKPDGARIWTQLTDFWRQENVGRGYDEVRTPILYDVDLWKQSGHWDTYRDNMYFTEVENRQMGLKPMNCPAHIQIYKSDRRSYRDLPIRYAEAGLVHRHEPSGTLHGLLRVRHITQDDGHIFCTEDQVKDEVKACLAFGFFIYDVFGFEPRLELSTRPGEAGGLGRDVGPRRGVAAGRAGGGGAGVRDQRGRRRLLRAQDRPAHDRLDRPLVAAGHGPAGLLDARAVRAGLHRRRQRGPPAGDDPPGADGQLRALHRHPDRALRRRVPAVAGAGPGAGAAHRRPPHRIRRAGRARAPRGGAAGGGRRPRRVGGAQDPRRRAAQGALPAGGGGRGGRIGAGGGAPPRRGRPGAEPVGDLVGTLLAQVTART